LEWNDVIRGEMIVVELFISGGLAEVKYFGVLGNTHVEIRLSAAAAAPSAAAATAPPSTTATASTATTTGMAIVFREVGKKNPDAYEIGKTAKNHQND
jgi:hypothetical protein